MAKKITVKTDVGEFTRETARTYSHIVVTVGLTPEREAKIAANYRGVETERAQYHEAVSAALRDGSRTPNNYGDDTPEHHDREAQEARERLAVIEATIAKEIARVSAPGAAAWCGRLDLAERQVDDFVKYGYASVRIYAVDGTRIK